MDDILPIGTRVHITEQGLHAYVYPSTQDRWRGRIGVVVGVTRDHSAYWIRWHETKTNTVWSRQWLEVVP